MVTATRAYGTCASPVAHQVPELPAVVEMHEVLTDVYMKFVNESVHATTIGFKQLDAGQFITLDELEALIAKK